MNLRPPSRENCPSGGDLPRRVAELADACDLLPVGASVVVGVSGGADSVALLSLLRSMASERKLRLTVAHLDHGIRGDSADDAQWVAALADRWELPCVVERRDVAAEARTAGIGLEEAARNTRYGFLAQVATQQGAARVAVGHHADDNAETVLYRIARGTHLRGLAGMGLSRPLGEAGCLLVRPLLTSRRAELEQYCRLRGLSWRTDATNADVSHRRNLLRSRVFPLLREGINPRTEEAILRLAGAAREANEFLEELAREAFSATGREEDAEGIVLDRVALVGIPDLVRTTLFRQVLERLGAPLKAVSTEAIRKLSDLPSAETGALALPGGFEARCSGKALRVGRVAELHAPAPMAPVALECPGRTPLPEGGSVVCEEISPDSEAFESHCRAHPEGVEWLDADRLVGPLVCRPRCAGDRFRPMGMKGSQTVGDFLANARIESSRRENVRCLCDDLGIVYLAPLRVEQRVRVTSATRRVWKISAFLPGWV
jgi:tRNA(Ile)-lysidine synthase